MESWLARLALLGGMLWGAAFLVLAGSPVRGQSGRVAAPSCPAPSPYCPAPAPYPLPTPPAAAPQPGTAPGAPTPSTPTPSPAPRETPTPSTPTPTTPAPTTPTPGTAQAGQMPQPSAAPSQPYAAVGAESGAFAAPNMVGHLLFASRSIDFRYNRAAGPVNVANNGSTSVINPSVADNNSPVPQDRVYFRFNYFNNSQQVVGFGPPVFNPQGVGTSFAQTRNYDVEQYTFGFEKTFLDGWGSVELRAPFNTALSSNLNLSAGDITGPGPGSSFGVNSTPERTLGSEGTQFQNMTLILKGLAYRSNPLAVSGGLALGIPTGADTNVSIVDYSGSVTQGQATIQRERLIHIDNETWSLSPFVAALYTPTNRFFAQGFLQFDLPLNASTINYTDTFTRGSSSVSVAALSQAGLLRYPSLDPPFSVRNGISEQPLMQLDLGAGYWLVRDPSRPWVTGIAPSLELHYTTTLKNASVVQLPGDPLFQIDPQTGRSVLVQEQPPRVGNLNNRVDILDMTVATTFLISNRATVATGFSFPLHGTGNRTFDWEYHLQVNFYWGGLRSPFAPGF